MMTIFRMPVLFTRIVSSLLVHERTFKKCTYVSVDLAPKFLIHIQRDILVIDLSSSVMSFITKTLLNKIFHHLIHDGSQLPF